MILDAALVRAGRALARGEPLAAISATGVREDPHALALRGVALAQLHEYGPAKALLTRAAAGFEREGAPLERARALAALAEIVAAERDVGRGVELLRQAAASLRELGDTTNAAWAALALARLSLLEGDAGDSASHLESARLASTEGAPTVLLATIALAQAEAAMRDVRAARADVALREARAWAERAGHPILLTEVEHLEVALRSAIGWEVRGAARVSLDLARLESLLAPPVMGSPRMAVVDGLARRMTSSGVRVADLRTRPVLLALLGALARVWPRPRAPNELIGEAFGARRVNESHRARLRVEIGRLRRLLGDAGTVVAERAGFRLEVKDVDAVVLVEPLESGDVGALRAILADGEAWPVKSLARALSRSPRTVQRALATLVESGFVRAIGNARARRYTRIDAGERIASRMLLLGIVGRRYESEHGAPD